MTQAASRWISRARNLPSRSNRRPQPRSLFFSTSIPRCRLCITLGFPTKHYGSQLNPRTKLVSFTQVSNALGTITPSAIMTAMAHAVGARVLLDGAQSVPHMRTDVQAIGCDWFVF